MAYSFKLLVAIIGLVLPGYLLAGLIGLRQRWLAAFPLSTLILVELVILFSLLHIPLDFILVAAAMAGVSLVCCLLRAVRKPCAPITMPVGDMDSRTVTLTRVSVGFALLLSLAVLYRSVLYPLSGYDTYFRWEGLARQMLRYKSLHFYPPITPQDFAVYTIPDGIPPLVASIYWWLYAAIGQPAMPVTSVSVVLQLVSVMALTYYGALYAADRSAACCALLAVSSSAMLVNGIAIGQETGFTAVSVAGQFCFAWAAVRNPKVSLVVTAGIFAALGALARDYGPALSLAGLAVLGYNQQTRRHVPAFIATVFVLSAPWYIRNWVLAGNPLYPHALPGGFAVNEIFLKLQKAIQGELSFDLYTVPQWLQHLGAICLGAPLVIFGGIPFGIYRWRELLPMMITAVFIALLWLKSMGDTAGGPVYSMRVLTPAFAALAITAGIAWSWGFERYSRFPAAVRGCVVAGLVACCGYSFASALAHPFAVRSVLSAMNYRYAGPPEVAAGSLELADRLQSSDLPATGVLTSNPYLAVKLRRETRFRPVMVWSPEVSFVFDPRLSVAEVQRRLKAIDVTIVSLHNGISYNDYFVTIPFYSNFLNKKDSTEFRLIAFVGAEALLTIEPGGSK